MPKKVDSKKILEKESNKISSKGKNTSTKKSEKKSGSASLATPKTKKTVPPKSEIEVKKKNTSKKTSGKSSTKKVSSSKSAKGKKAAKEKSLEELKKAVARNILNKKIEENTKLNVIEKNKKEELKSATSKIENRTNEETVIEKIKNFIAKIAAMQEEATNGEIEKTAGKEKKKITKKKEVKKQQYSLEYYDLVYRYNETIVKILAQTPKRLFVYWDVSDDDRQKYIQTFGEDFFEKTYPVLLVYNEDRKYVKEVAVNDFANSWYIDVQDPKNKYTIQLGRKFRQVPHDINMEKVREENIILKTDYLPLANSNKLEAPNDHVLLESLPRYITFRNVKTNEEVVKSIGDFKDAFGNNYSVDGFYNEQYKDEISDRMFDMSNPSSGVNSSMFK